MQSIAPAAGCACRRAAPHPPAFVKCTQLRHWSKITGLAPVVAVTPPHLTGEIDDHQRRHERERAPQALVPLRQRQ